MSPNAGMTARRTRSRRRMRRLENEKRPMPYPVTGFFLCVNDPVGRRLGQEEEVYLSQVSALTGFLSLLKGCKINAIQSPSDLQSIERAGGRLGEVWGLRVLGLGCCVLAIPDGGVSISLSAITGQR